MAKSTNSPASALPINRAFGIGKICMACCILTTSGGDISAGRAIATMASGMKRYTRLLGLMATTALLLPISANAAVHLGLPSAVKSTVKKLSAKVKSKVPSYTLAANTIILSQQTNSYLVSADTTTQIYYYSSQAAEVAALTPGKIILSTQGDGFLRKVDSVVFNGSQYEVRTTTATAEEAFEEADIAFTKQLLPQEITPAGFYQAKGVSINPSSVNGEFTVVIASAVLYDYDENPDTKDDQIIAVGTFKFTAAVEGVLKIGVIPLGLQELKLQGTVRETSDITVKWETSVGLSLPDDMKSIKIAQYPFPPMVFGAVVVVPVISVVVGAKGNINVSCTAESSVFQTASYTAGVWYKDGAWSPISEFTSDFGFTPPYFSYDISARIKTYAGPQLDLKFWNVVGPAIGVYGYFDGTAEGTILPPSVTWSNYGGLEGTGGGEMTIFSLYKANYTVNLFDHRILIASGTIQPAPSAPSGLSAVAVSSTQINLTWQDNSNNEDGFKLELKTGLGGTYAQIASPAAGLVSYSNTGLSAGTTYYYRVRAYNSAGDSDYSNEANTFTLPADSANHAPVISSLSASPASVSTGAATTITCAASDEDSDTLTYTWSAASGTLSGSGAQVTWTAPDIAAGYTIICTVTDVKGGSAQQILNITAIESDDLIGRAFPDTGETQSFTIVFGEDHDYRPAVSQPSYTNNGDGTTTDNRTGLVWQVSSIGNTPHWEDALNFCENLTYAGYSDWRLPNRRELLSIVDFGRYGPALDPAYFPGTPNGDYWTATTSPGYPTGAYRINIINGSLGGFEKSQSYSNYFYSRCVRVSPAGVLPDTGQGQSFTNTLGEDHDYQPAASQPSYTDNGNGTTSDNRTGLMWAQDGLSDGCNYGNSLSFNDALAYCENLTYAGYSDWRLPNIRELDSIVDAGRSSPSINPVYFPNTKFGYYSNVYYWSSTAYWWVDFQYGSLTDDNSTSDKSSLSFYVRCARTDSAGNTLPDAPASMPSVFGSAPLYVNQAYTYSTSASDPDGDQVKYRFYFDSDTVYTETGYVSSGASASVTHIYTTIGTKNIKVKAVDAHGAESASWSSVLNVTMQVNLGGGGEI